MDMKTPLKQVYGLGSSKSGTSHFWYQRLTALANVPLFLYFIVLMFCMGGASYDEAVKTLSSPFNSLMLLLLMGSSIYHMKLGMQVVIEDYVHGEAARTVLLIANLFVSVLLATIAFFAILKLGFAG